MLMPCETSRRPSSTVWNVCSTCIADYGSGFFSTAHVLKTPRLTSRSATRSWRFCLGEPTWRFVSTAVRLHFLADSNDRFIAMGNVSHHVDYVSSVPAVRAFFYCVYGLVFAVGVSGNALVCFVVARQRAMHTVTNLFIANLALSDILLCTLAVPFTPLHQFVGAWPLGSALCRMVPYAQGVSVYVSSFTLTAIAVDRFFVIMHPFRGRLRLPVCGALIVLIWVAGALLTLPYGLFIGLTADGGSFCEERWPSEESRRAFSLCTSALQFGVPFTVISFCYMRVCCKLRERARAKPGAKSMQKEQLERRRTRRTNRMLVSMVVIFGACWLPLNLYNLAIDFSLRAASWQFANAFFFLAHAIAVSSTCYNPFLYTWLNDSFRKEFKAVLPCFSSRRAELPPVRYVCSGDAVKL